MAKFNFELEGVLRQRTNAEHIAQRDLATATQTMVQLQAKLKRLDESVKAVTEDVRANHLTGQLDVSFITAHRRYMVSMERAAIDLARQIAEAQAIVNKAQQALVDASRQRKTIEKLRDKQFERFMADQMKRENEALDEAGMQIAYRNLTESN